MPVEIYFTESLNYNTFFILQDTMKVKFQHKKLENLTICQNLIVFILENSNFLFIKLLIVYLHLIYKFLQRLFSIYKSYLRIYTIGTCFLSESLVVISPRTGWLRDPPLASILFQVFHLPSKLPWIDLHHALKEYPPYVFDFLPLIQPSKLDIIMLFSLLTRVCLHGSYEARSSSFETFSTRDIVFILW